MRKTVLISGNFDPFHYAHLDYIRQAAKLGDQLICVVSSDKQVMKKKGKVNEPEEERAQLLCEILKGCLGCPFIVLINQWDKNTTLVAEALKAVRPTIFCRGTDKILVDMPSEEMVVCRECGIQIVHVQGKIAHGSNFG